MKVPAMMMVVLLACGCVPVDQAAEQQASTPAATEAAPISAIETMIYEILLENPEGLTPLEIHRAVEDRLNTSGLGETLTTELVNARQRLQARGLIERLEFGDTEVIYRILPTN